MTAPAPDVGAAARARPVRLSMSTIDLELALAMLGAMFSPTTATSG
jgi:hypothetical protein